MSKAVSLQRCESLNGIGTGEDFRNTIERRLPACKPFSLTQKSKLCGGEITTPLHFSWSRRPSLLSAFNFKCPSGNPRVLYKPSCEKHFRLGLPQNDDQSWIHSPTIFDSYYLPKVYSSIFKTFNEQSGKLMMWDYHSLKKFKFALCFKALKIGMPIAIQCPHESLNWLLNHQNANSIQFYVVSIAYLEKNNKRLACFCCCVRSDKQGTTLQDRSSIEEEAHTLYLLSCSHYPIRLQTT